MWPWKKCRWQRWILGSSMNCAAPERCSHEREHSGKSSVAGRLERTASAGDAGVLRGDGAAGGEGNPELRAVAVGAGRAEMRSPTAESDRQAVARVGTTAGEDAGQLRAEALADQGGAAA